jgi:hypothetical protein
MLPWGLVGVLLAGVALGMGLGLSEAPTSIVTSANAFVNGRISAEGGAFLRDRYGRVVILHGVNAVYKHPPYELYDAPGKPWDFSAADAAKIASLGFDVVRLGIVWAGLEPGKAGSNNPAICTPGKPDEPTHLDTSVLDAYLARVKRTVDLLGRYHVYTLLDMHQDLYSQVLGGEGAPAWAVCTDGLQARHPPGRWSRAYSTPAVQAAFENFWNNDVVGDLQGHYDRVWSARPRPLDSRLRPLQRTVCTVGARLWPPRAGCPDRVLLHGNRASGHRARHETNGRMPPRRSRRRVDSDDSQGRPAPPDLL